MIRTQEISKQVGQRTLWSGVNLAVRAGEMMAIRGPSGSGKSTLLNCLGLLDPPSAGRIFIKNVDATAFSSRERRIYRRDTLGYLFQNYALIDNATIQENLAFAGGGLRKLSIKEKRKSYCRALDHVGLSGRGNDLVYELSGGEQQRVALARLLVKEPLVVLADEPTGALDEQNSEMVISTLRHMAKQGSTVLIATHNDQIDVRCDTRLDLQTFVMNTPSDTAIAL